MANGEQATCSPFDHQDQFTPFSQSRIAVQKRNFRDQAATIWTFKTNLPVRGCCSLLSMSKQNNKVVLITGASAGIGKATALHLIAQGHTVFGAARRVDAMQDLVAAGGHALALDVTDEAAIQTVVAQVLAEAGHIDVLINNAGYAVYGSVEDVSLEDARRQFEVNLFGVAALTKAVLPGMRARRQGTIINVSSVGGKIYTPLGAWYHATKHALEGWSDCLRLELKQFGIDVVIVEPGAIRTEFTEVMNDPMLERSAAGPYAAFAKTVVDASKKTYENASRASGPEVVAKTIAEAIAAHKPKTRYATGAFSSTILTLRKLLSDRMFDKMILSQVK